MEGEVSEGGMIRPGTRGVGVNGVMEGEDVGWTRLARRLKISPGGGRGSIVGKDKERTKKQMKGGARTSTGLKGVGEDEFKGVKEGVEGSKGRGDGGVESPAMVRDGGMWTGGVEVI